MWVHLKLYVLNKVGLFPYAVRLIQPQALQVVL